MGRRAHVCGRFHKTGATLALRGSARTTAHLRDSPPQAPVAPVAAAASAAGALLRGTRVWLPCKHAITTGVPSTLPTLPCAHTTATPARLDGNPAAWGLKGAARGTTLAAVGLLQPIPLPTLLPIICCCMRCILVDVWLATNASHCSSSQNRDQVQVARVRRANGHNSGKRSSGEGVGAGCCSLRAAGLAGEGVRGLAGEGASR